MSPATPKYVERIARLPLVFEHLAAHPEGARLTDVAAALSVNPDQLREDLLAFYTADVDSELLMGLSRPTVLEFLGPDGDDEDPNDAEVVRIADSRGADELGVERVDAAELALIYTAARALLDLEDDPDLAAAVEVLAETMGGGSPTEDADEAGLGGVAEDGVSPGSDALAVLRGGQEQLRRVRIEYSRAWAAGVSERTIDPYRLVRTHRGWEVDAGPPDDQGALRTFLVGNVRRAELLDDVFETPPDLDDRLAAQRATERVRVELPQSARWAADMYAERVHVVDDQETVVVLDLDLLPPLRHRVGLMLLASGPDAQVLEPADLADAGSDLARTLLEHHGAAGH